LKLNVVCESSCNCEPGKIKSQLFHQNNFMHLINAQEVIDMQHSMIKNKLAGGTVFKKTELEAI